VLWIWREQLYADDETTMYEDSAKTRCFV